MASKAADLKVGDTAAEAINLKMYKGVGEAFLVPGDPDDGQPGRNIIEAGDVITAGTVARLAAAEENQLRLDADDKPARSSRRGRKAAAPTPTDGVGVPTAEGDGAPEPDADADTDADATK